jgi:hypothetical protein
MEIQPRHVVCILNNDQDVIRNLCKEYPGFEYDEEYSHGHFQEGMSTAFAASMECLIPSFVLEDQESIYKHTAVNYVLSPKMQKEDAVDISHKMLSFVAEAFELGALAVKGESSGIAHGKLRWLELSERSKEPENQLSSLYRAWVRLPLSDESKLYSVGMHLIGMKDVEINNCDSAIDDLDMFLLYLVVDRAEPNIKNGQTFSEDNESMLYTINGIDCNQYESDDFFYNPYGLWSLTSKQT